MFLGDNHLIITHYVHLKKYHHSPWICMNFMSQLEIKEMRLSRKLLFSVPEVRNRSDTGQEASLCICCQQWGWDLFTSSPLFPVRSCFILCLIPLSQLPKWCVWSRCLQGQLLSPCLCVELVSRWLVIKHSMELHVYSTSSLKNCRNYR